MSMAKTKHFIYLSDEDRAHLEGIIKTAPEKTAMRAKILLASDFNNPKYYSVHALSEELGVSQTTIQVVRSEYTKLGVDGAVYPKGTLAYDKRALMTEEKRNQILEMIKGRPPYGQRRWTIRNICDECVKRGIFDNIATSVVLKLLKEANIDLKNPNNL
jgi:transposase